MMAAGRAGELGAHVFLLEKNSSLGIKLLATGHGRCNLSNDIADIRDLAKHYGKNGSFLFSALHQFGVIETKEFFQEHGLPLKTEAGERIFPKSDKARDVLSLLEKYLKKGGVEIKYNSAVKNIVHRYGRIEKLILQDNIEIIADNYIFALGGRSYPATGSTGDAYRWLKNLGHTIITPRPILGPLIVKDRHIKAWEGLSLKAVEFSVFHQGKRIARMSGEAMVTADGFSGPAIFSLSRMFDLNHYGDSEINLDFFPELDNKQLDNLLLTLLARNTKRNLGKALQEILPPKFIQGLGVNKMIDIDKKVDEISREQRRDLLKYLKSLNFSIYAWAGFDRAMVTAGGVSLKEVDPKTMRSKLIDNLFFAGEILDLDGPTGGFNLQMCWTTGYVAGEAASFN